MEYIALILFGAILIVLLTGFPVAFVLGGMAVLVGYFQLGPEFFAFLPSRVMGVMSNYVLIAVPLFIFMGITMQRTGIAESLLISMSRVFSRIKGGMAVSVIVVGALMAASTGIVGATVVTMGTISLPIMLRYGYKPSLASGVVASAGTLGQIIPPSIVLVLLGSVFNISVGDLFGAAVIPGVLLVLMYLVYTVVITQFTKGAMDTNSAKLEMIKSAGEEGSRQSITLLLKTLVIPLTLIVVVLGSIFAGIASPTEAAAIGAAGALLIGVSQGKLDWTTLKDISVETTHMTSMVFFILLGATTFTLVFRGLNGDIFLIDFFTEGGFTPWGFLGFVMLVVFVAGFFIDFIEIIFILVPVILPILKTYNPSDFSPVFHTMPQLLLWFALLLALNLQTSFLTPPFGFSLFYLKGVAPPEVQTKDIYRGIVPFILIQLALILLVMFYPQVITYVVN